ncbi:MAG: hypothetical protein ACRBCT_08155 [Alphaproteobacteria bacterium]
MKFTIWNVTGAIVSLAFGGPLGLIIFFFLWLVIWYHSSLRGLLFIQCYIYLMMVNTDEVPPYDASIKANNLNVHEASGLLMGAIDFANRFASGQQLPVIKEAKEQGYIYKKKSFVELMKEAWGD